MKPKVSVIIPIWNVEKYLKRCLDSILNQSLRDIEIILVDDESPNNCPQMCDDYMKYDNRIKVIHKKNQGLGMARNSGLEIATGEYVIFIDSDDFVDLRMFEILYNTAKKYNLDACYSGFNYYNNGVVLSKPEVQLPVYYNGEKNVKSFILDLVGPSPDFPREVKYSMSVCKTIFKTELIKINKIKFVSERIMASEDLIFELDFLPKATNVAVIPDCLYYYCNNEGSITRSYTDLKYERIKKCLIEVKNKLSLYFFEENYAIHYKRYLFLSLRGILSHEFFSVNKSFRAKYKNAEKRINDDVFQFLFSDYPYNKLELKKRLLYKSLKNRYILFVYLILFLQRLLKK